MKKIFTIALLLLICKAVIAQNYFPASGNVGIGTNSPTAALNINQPFPQLKIQGASGAWINSDVIISRTSSNPQLFKSPNIAFVDEATNSNGYIQCYLGNISLWPGGIQTLTCGTSGFVGINAANPTSIFQVNNYYTKFNVGSASAIGGSSYIGFNAAKLANGNWHFDGSPSYLDGGAVIYADLNGNINFAAVPSLNGVNYFEQTDADLKTRIQFQVSSGGYARAKKLKVEVTNWPDYVFGRSYKIPTLAAVGKYVTNNHHLPEIPTAQELENDGLDVGEMNKLLLKKVEELTLYLIEKDKEIMLIKKRLTTIERKAKKRR